MAVSYQWYIQWSPPPMVVADIDKQYENVNPHWGNMGPRTQDSGYKELSPTLKHLIEKGYNDTYYGRRKSVTAQSYDSKLKKGVAPAAALSLWMTMLGVAQPQSIPADNDTPPFHTLYKWSQIDFAFPTPLKKIRAISAGKYVPSAVLPLGMEVVKDRIFLTFPMWRSGVPATLATVSTEGGIPSPFMKPYPDWTYHEGFSRGDHDTDQKKCQGMTSVLRVNADHCGRLWVLDAGQIDMQDDPKQVCPPSIFIFDTHKDQLIGRYEIPTEYVLEDSLFSNIIVDTQSKNCDDLYAYISDTWRFGLLVFRLKDKEFWRFSNPFFFPDPLKSQFSLHGLRFQWTDGILGLSLSPVTENGDRILYFSPMSSDRQFYVFTSVIKNPRNINNSSEAFKVFGESRGARGQVSTAAIDRRGVMFYGLVTQDSVGCWDTSKKYTNSNNALVATNYETLIFPNEIKVDYGKPQKVWVLSNRLPFFQEGDLVKNDYNYRIMFADTKEAVRGTVCDTGDE